MLLSSSTAANSGSSSASSLSPMNKQGDLRVGSATTANWRKNKLAFCLRGLVLLGATKAETFTVKIPHKATRRDAFHRIDTCMMKNDLVCNRRLLMIYCRVGR
mmetsp:Transcript_26791/g.44657  ORF Transcript_26791/g.44657 Transcript_26791/m.44657 type:complete len:103 (+) Transcript_26791:300-608(+)